MSEHRIVELHFHTFKVGNEWLWRWGWDLINHRLFAVDLGPVGIALKLIK